MIHTEAMEFPPLWLALTVLALGACAGPPAAEAPTPPSRAVVVAAPGENEQDGTSVGDDAMPDDSLFLWTVSGEDDPQTYWVESVQGKPTERGVVAGVVVAAAGHVWRWRTESETVTTAPCAALGTGVDAPSGGSVQRGWFESVDGAGSSQVVSEPSEGSEFDLFEERVVPLGSAGPFVFVRQHYYLYACGAAHGQHSTSVFTWDLGRGKRAEVEPSEYDSQELRGAAHEQLREHALDEGQDMGALDLKALLPIYDQRGHLSLGRVYVTDACYACSDGWGSYLRGATIPGPPPRWQGVRPRAPRTIAAFLGRRPQLTLRGWSRAPRLDAASAAVRQLFAAASHASQGQAR